MTYGPFKQATLAKTKTKKPRRLRFHAGFQKAPLIFYVFHYVLLLCQADGGFLFFFNAYKSRLFCETSPFFMKESKLKQVNSGLVCCSNHKKKNEIILIAATGIQFNTAVINDCCIYIQKQDHVFLSFTTKPLSVASMLQILLSENPESNILPCESRRAIIQRACACYDRDVEREKTNSKSSRRSFCMRQKVPGV